MDATAGAAPIRQALTSPDPAQAAVPALLAFHAVRMSEIRQLTLADVRDLAAGRLYLPGRPHDPGPNEQIVQTAIDGYTRSIGRAMTADLAPCTRTAPRTKPCCAR